MRKTKKGSARSSRAEHLNLDLIWMPHAGHLIVSNDCRFHLATYVDGYIVSTVGEYLPDSDTRDILAKSRGIKLEGRGGARRYDWMQKAGYEEIGAGRKYETMVFRAVKAKDHCCPYRQENGAALDFAGYNDSGEAREGHMRMIAKWAPSS